MKNTLFAKGKPQGISDVLQNKEHRVFVQQQLCMHYPEDIVIALKLNIPGPIKNNEELKKLFWTGAKELELRCQRENFGRFKKTIFWNEVTGSELFEVYEVTPKQAKSVTVDFENEFPLGRLFDADVLSKQTDFQPVSRASLNIAVRKCLLCDRPAKECARSRKHSVAELQKEIAKMWQEFQV